MEPATKRRKLSSSSKDGGRGLKENATEQDNKRSLFVRSLPASVTKERLIEHFSQSYPLKHATVVLDSQTKVSRGFGFVTFTDAEDAKQALAKFDKSELDGRKIRVEPAEARLRETEDGVPRKGHSKNTKAEELRARRQQQQEGNQPPKLIVRNLPWSIKTPEDLTKLFLSYGKVKHAVVPKLPGENGAQAGFGIVIIRGKQNAERAMQGVNGKLVDGRTLAVDWAVDKDTWQKMQKEEREQAKVNDVSALAVGDQPTEPEAVVGGSEPDAEDAGVALQEADLEVPEAETLGEGEDDTDQEDLSADDISDIAAEEEADNAVDTATKYNTENTTVFIRNLAYDTDDESLQSHFTTHFGPVRYARVVYDQETERSRGTAFVCFRDESDAKACVKECPLKQDSMNIPSKDNRGQPSILQNDSLDPSGKYMLSSRLLHITRALPKPEAESRADDSRKTRLAKQLTDKRRLYLLSEGTVSPGSSLYSTLSKAELDIRSSSAKQRRKLVQTNPNLGLSLTRLSIRNLPRWIESKSLKSLAREAIVGFASDVKSGIRSPISKEELARDGEVGRTAEKARKEQGKGVVKQAKIVYESEKTGTKISEGKGGRSRGYGFIEYWGHRSALMGLRWLNGYLVKRPQDKEVDTEGERGKRLIVEFAIENAQVVQRRSDRERRDKLKRQKQNDVEEDEALVEQDNAKGKYGKDKNGKRKRDSKDEGDNTKAKKLTNGAGAKLERLGLHSEDAQDDKNKVAARNRIIAQKRQKRRNRKG